MLVRVRVRVCVCVCVCGRANLDSVEVSFGGGNAHCRVAFGVGRVHVRAGEGQDLHRLGAASGRGQVDGARAVHHVVVVEIIQSDKQT
jgi:hypothetical protein